MYTCSKKRHYSFCGRRGTGRAHCCGEHSFASYLHKSQCLKRTSEVLEDFPGKDPWELTTLQKLAHGLKTFQQSLITQLIPGSRLIFCGSDAQGKQYGRELTKADCKNQVYLPFFTENVISRRKA